MRIPQLLLLLVISPAAFAFDFKGFTIGAPAKPEEVKEKLGVKCGLGSGGSQVCNGRVTVGKEPAQMNMVINPSGIIQRIRLSLSPNAFEIIAPLLTEKFGAPTKTERGEVQNRMGAKFDQTSMLWRGENGVEVIYQKYTGSLDSSSLYFSTAEDRELMLNSRGDRRGDL